jgi:signal peptidase I
VSAKGDEPRPARAKGKAARSPKRDVAPVDDARDDDERTSEPTDARAGTSAKGEARPEALSPERGARPGQGPAVLRYAFYGVWVAAVPFALAVITVWLLTPRSATAPVGGLRQFVGEQQIPAGIVLFTIFLLVIWRFRHDLPLSGAIGVGGRRDIPPKLRARYEDAGALLEEARGILRSRKREVEKELVKSEREEIQQALADLERTMAEPKFDADGFDLALARADRLVGEHLSRWRKGEIREYAESIGIAVGVALILRAFAVEAFKIPSGSMIPTLVVGDHIFVNKFSYGPLVPWTNERLFERMPPSRGDVMVFKFPENEEQDFIKRVIAVPGDVLEAIDGRPIINGWVVPDCKVGPFRYDGRDAELYVEFLGDQSYFTLFDDPPSNEACETSRDCINGLTCRAGMCGVLQGPFRVAKDEAWVMGDNRNNSHDSRSWRAGLGAGVPFENIKGRAMFVWLSFGPGGAFASDRLMVNVMGKPTLPSGYESLQPAVDRCLRERPAQTTPPPPK